MSLKKWHEVYNGPTERNFFIGKDGNSGLVRSQYDYRSSAALAKEAGITKEECEKIIAKFLKLGVVVQSQSKEDHFGYWMRVSPHLANTVQVTIAQADQAARVKKATKP